MYSAQVEVNWTLVLAEELHTFCIRKLKFNFSFSIAGYFVVFLVTVWHCRFCQSLKESVYHP